MELAHAMLVSETANPWMPQPYRNRENFNRVITNTIESFRVQP